MRPQPSTCASYCAAHKDGCCVCRGPGAAVSNCGTRSCWARDSTAEHMPSSSACMVSSSSSCFTVQISCRQRAPHQPAGALSRNQTRTSMRRPEACLFTASLPAELRAPASACFHPRCQRQVDVLRDYSPFSTFPSFQFTFAGIERNKNTLAKFRTRLVCVDSFLVAARRAAAAWALAQKRMPDSDVVANNHHDEEVLVSDAESVPDSDGEESKARGKTGRLGTVRCARARMRAAAPTAGRPGSQGPWSGPMRLRGQVGRASVGGWYGPHPRSPLRDALR